MTLHNHFPHPALARSLWPHAFDARDGAHDEAHLRRVWRNVADISASEGGDSEILVAATILHDCVWVDKASPARSSASRLAAARADTVLAALGWSDDRRARVRHCIEAHSFSANIAPVSLEAKILRDADRLDAIGWIGVARCFYVAGLRRAALYDIDDPAALHRPLDDVAYALDHFRTKLMTLGDGFCTALGRELAAQRTADLKRFYQGLLSDIGPQNA